MPASTPSLFTAPLNATSPLAVAERPAALEIIDREVKACTLCTELVQNRTQTVFGVGNVAPRVCFFGEAPGADEDRQGEPFVGRAGKLLNDIIKAMTLQREDVYILNVCKCRPPGNRTPLPDEAANCRHFWERQLEILRPEYVVCLGACAAQNMLQTTQSIGRLRGRFHDHRGIKAVATYHPAYLLRNPEAKRDVWNDMQMLMRDMGIEVPQKNS
jgi:uracil-DNA glycosylase family 4